MKIELPKFDMDGPDVQIFPNPGEAVCQCSRCSGRTFQVHVLPDGTGGAFVSELVCLSCGHSAKLRPQSLEAH